MQNYAVQKDNKCLVAVPTFIGRSTAQLTYSATGSNYVNGVTTIDPSEDLTRYYCLVNSTGTINVYANVVNIGGQVVVQFRTDYRVNTEPDTINVSALVYKHGLRI